LKGETNKLDEKKKSQKKRAKEKTARKGQRGEWKWRGGRQGRN